MASWMPDQQLCAQLVRGVAPLIDQPFTLDKHASGPKCEAVGEPVGDVTLRAQSRIERIGVESVDRCFVRFAGPKNR